MSALSIVIVFFDAISMLPMIREMFLRPEFRVLSLFVVFIPNQMVALSMLLLFLVMFIVIDKQMINEGLHQGLMGGEKVTRSVANPPI